MSNKLQSTLLYSKNSLDNSEKKIILIINRHHRLTVQQFGHFNT